jgi:hypothetical protein
VIGACHSRAGETGKYNMHLFPGEMSKAPGRRWNFAFPCVLALALAGQSARAESPPDKSGYTFLNPTPVELLRDMTLDGPGATESPYTVDAGHFQVEMTLFGRSSYEEELEGVDYKFEWWSVGPLNLKAGLLNNLEVQLILEPYNHAVESEVGFSRVESEGFGDTTLRFKFNLWGNDHGRTALALIPYGKFPTSEDGVGNDYFEGGMVLPFSAELTAGLYLGLTSQFSAARSEGEDSYHAVYQNSISLAADLFWNLDGYVEFFSSVSTEQDTEWVGTVNTGLAWWLTDDFQLNTAVDVGVTRSADDWFVSFGAAWRY